MIGFAIVSITCISPIRRRYITPWSIRLSSSDSLPLAHARLSLCVESTGLLPFFLVVPRRQRQCLLQCAVHPCDEVLRVGAGADRLAAKDNPNRHRGGKRVRTANGRPAVLSAGLDGDPAAAAQAHTLRNMQLALVRLRLHRFHDLTVAT